MTDKDETKGYLGFDLSKDKEVTVLLLKILFVLFLIVKISCNQYNISD